MANKMLIDATHPEETRVVVLRGNRVEEFDFETAHRKQLRGNIYLAKVTRVEPSLQAAFIDYGGNRHGFLAFSEIHPDYYQIPVADRQALIEADAREAREHDSDDDRGNGRRNRGRNRHRERPHARRRETVQSDPLAAPESSQGAAEFPAGETMPSDSTGGHGDDISAAEVAQQNEAHADDAHHDDAHHDDRPHDDHSHDDGHHDHEHDDHGHDEHPHESPAPFVEAENQPVAAEGAASVPAAAEFEAPSSEIPADVPFEAAPLADSETLHPEGAVAPASEADGNGHSGHGAEEEEEIVESVGGSDALEEAADRAPRFRRQYKIQEVIKRRQVMLVQVVKEERGTKGAALTTYLSLAGRYCVLMPNTARGGGISRKITSADDRKKLREIAEELEVPEGMGVILRTAGAARTKAEVKRDFEYLLRQWELVRDLTLKSTAPTLVYEEGSLAKRSIRDLYSKDIDEIIVAGENGYRDAKEFMRMLMPSHAKNVKLYNDTQPVFTRYGIESQLDAMFSPTVQLRSGGYIVLNQTEALVSIDVNSGRSTREHHIEDTALKTNVEASEEIARQLRLRDLAGLIVIDYIDMDEKRNNRTVERRLKDALRNDRARIQVGRISHFGLMEMSRQRIRTSVLESSTEKCPHCGGTGHVRSVSSVALQLLRSVEEMLLKGPTHNLIVRTRPEIALYVLNHKRAHLRGLEERFRVTLTVNSDEEVGGQTGFVIDRGDQVMTIEQAKALVAQAEAPPLLIEEDEPESADAALDEDQSSEDADTFASTAGTDDGLHTDAPQETDTARDDEGREGGRDGRGRRRRRRGRGRGGRNGEDRAHGLGHDLGQSGPQSHGAEPRSFEPGEPMADDQPLAFVGDSDSAAGQSAAPMHDREARQHSENGDPRRRRRGRRGGRRNRRDRDENFNAAGPQGHESPENQEHSSTIDRPPGNDPSRWNEPQPVVDVSEPPLSEPTSRVEYSPPPQPTPQPAASAPMAEAPRRRSTVREPAPVFSGESSPVAMPTPQPPPATSAVEADEASKPRRTGWWAKRLLGGDKG